MNRGYTTLLEKYEFSYKLGHGSFGEIYEGFVISTGKPVAVKVEANTTREPQLHYESKVLRTIRRGVGIPQFYDFIIGEEFQEKLRFMVFEKLGPSLEDLFNACQRKFTLKTVLMLAKQMLIRLQFLHECGIIHRDIKPDNFLMGLGKSVNCVYVVDFGLAKRYTNEYRHISLRQGKSLTGTARYASLNTHFGIEQSRRDDLESLGYVLVYFLKGCLPWQGLKANNKISKYTLIFEKKIMTDLSELTKDLPEEFYEYFNYCRSLKFSEKPSYEYLHDLFSGLFEKMGYKYDNKWDWNEEPFSVIELAKNSSIFSEKNDKARNTPVSSQEKEKDLSFEIVDFEVEPDDYQRWRP